MERATQYPAAGLLAAESVTSRYDGAARSAKAAVDGVTLTLRAGELTVLIGPNGSGKSALLRALSRTLAPQRGSIRALIAADDGEAAPGGRWRDLYTQCSARVAARAIAVVPQSEQGFLDFTLREIVAMGRAPRQRRGGAWTTADEQCVAAALRAMEIDDALAARSITRVSGGERQRALIARALAQATPILLLDEPTAALDLRGQRHLFALLRQWLSASGAANGPRGVLLALHDLNAAAEVADRIVALSAGRIVGDGAPADVLTPELLLSVYGVHSTICSHPLTGRPLIVATDAAASGHAEEGDRRGGALG